jgi:hypothetical protein
MAIHSEAPSEQRRRANILCRPSCASKNSLNRRRRRSISSCELAVWPRLLATGPMGRIRACIDFDSHIKIATLDR